MKEVILNLIKQHDLNISKIVQLTNLSEEECYTFIQELVNDKQIFLNDSKKYEVIKDNYMVGVLEKTHKDYSYVVCDGKRILIDSNSLHTALKNDLVVVELIDDNHGLIKGILKRKNEKLVCEVKEYKNKLVLVPFNGNCEIHLITPRELLKDYIIGDRVYIILPNESNEDNVVVVKDITKIGHFNDEFNDEISIAISKDFDIEFSDKAIKEAEMISNVVLDSEKKGRIDLTNENIFTIDSIHTKDMDDAISIKKLPNGNYELGVHIADVSHYIKPGTTLFKEAMERGTSVYIGEVVIPMIPSILSNGICSLNEGVERLTKSCIMEITPKGKVVNYKILDTVIKSKKKMTYEDLNELFSGNLLDESYIPFINDLNIMRELSNILTVQKRRSGHIDFGNGDINIIKDIYENDKILEFDNKANGESEKIIENFMVLANETVATDFYWRYLPFIYRIHDTPEEMRLEDTIEQIKELGLGKQLIALQNSYGPKAIQGILEQYRETPMYQVVANLLLRSMAKAKYSTENIGHFALSLDSYCHFTSPIRRFPDLIDHTLINIFNNKENVYENIDKLKNALSEIAIHSSYKERQAEDAERDFIKLKMAEYMDEHKDEVFEGIILDIEKDKIFIKLDNNIKCLLDNSGEFASLFSLDPNKKVLYLKDTKEKIKLGTRVSIKVTRVDIPQKEVYVDVMELVNSKENSYVKKLKI